MAFALTSLNQPLQILYFTPQLGCVPPDDIHFGEPVLHSGDVIAKCRNLIAKSGNLYAPPLECHNFTAKRQKSCSSEHQQPHCQEFHQVDCQMGTLQSKMVRYLQKKTWLSMQLYLRQLMK